MAISFHAPPSNLLCHLSTEPVCPARVITPVLSVRQMGEFPPPTLPPTDAGSTWMVLAAENRGLQAPFCTSARYSQLPEEGGISACVVVVLAMSVHPPEPPSLLCHLSTDPVCPERVMVPVLVPSQIGEVPPETLPPTVGSSTTMVLKSELTLGQLPLLTTAR